MQQLAREDAARIEELLKQNTRLTELTADLSRRIADLTDEIHRKVVRSEA